MAKTSPRLSLAVGAGALLLAGCTEPYRPPTANLDGVWVSTFSSEFVGLDLRQSGDRVSGRAGLTPRGEPANYEVRGTVRGSELTATLHREGMEETVALRAALRRDTLSIRLDGGGFSSRFVPLVRE